MLVKLDVDGKKVDWRRIRTVLNMFELKVRLKESAVMKTKNGFHIYLKLETARRISDSTLCFLQLAMGSDYKREIFNWNRIRYGSKWQKNYWNVLFKAKFHTKNGKIRKVSYESPLPKSILKRRLKDYVV